MRVQCAPNISLLFTEHPMLERPGEVARHGFTAAECWWPFGADPHPSDAEVDAFVAALDEAKVRLVGLNFYAGDMPAGERGVLSHPDRQQEFRSSVATVIRIAKATGCRAFNALYGVRDDRFAASEQGQCATGNLVFAAAAVAEIGGVVLIEALASGENGSYPLCTPVDVAAVLDAAANAGAANVRMLADFYHFARNGVDWREVLGRYSDRIGHVQIADSPGRHEPGTGTIDFPGLLSALEGGYAGWVGLEYRPQTTTSAGLGWISDLGLQLSEDAPA
jgi:hydroxypyruvate isomerase